MISAVLIAVNTAATTAVTAATTSQRGLHLGRLEARLCKLSGWNFPSSQPFPVVGVTGDPFRGGWKSLSGNDFT
jgi:hypothetical protein